MICTFYSYKGGVGRSMALANVGDILARRGLRVLMIDFDLEAPGLEQFFPISQPRVRNHEGLLDLLLSYKLSMSETGDSHDGRSFEQLHERFILPVYDNLPSGGRLDLMPAGQRDTEEQLARYALNLRTFDWQDFYFRWAGGAFFEWLRDSLLKPSSRLPEKYNQARQHEPYDVVLVDSRTGVTEMGGICAYQLADTIVMLCASNHQNVEGTLSMIQNFYSQRVQSLRQDRPLKVVTAPARIEQMDPSLLANFRDRFDNAFDQYTPKEFQSKNMKFWDLLIPYEPRYAFEEQVVSQRRMTSAFEKLVTAISILAEPDERAKLASENGSSTGGEAFLPQYDVTRRFAGYDVFLSFHEDNEGEATALARRLKEELGLDVMLDSWGLVAADSWLTRAEESLFVSKSCFLLVGPSGLGPWENARLLARLAQNTRENNLSVVSITLGGSETLGLKFVGINDKWQSVSFQEVMGDAGLTVLRLLSSINQPASEIRQTVVEHGAPYVGLQPFDEKHSQLFYGREPMIRHVIEQVRGGRSFALIGPSGCGKSSLIRAGLFPALRRNELPGSDHWLLTSLRPGANPITSLANVLNTLNSGSVGDQSYKEITACLEADGRALDNWLRSFLITKTNSGSTERRLVLFVDQFEEVFTQCKGKLQRDRFIDNLMYAVSSPRTPLTLIVGLRSDFINPLANYPRMTEWLQSNLVIVSQMTREQLKEIVERPAQKVGLAFEPGLVERILDEVSSSPGALPLLQFLLFELWERRREGFLTIRAYEESGGVAGAIAKRADASYQSFDRAQQAVVRRVMLRLIQPGVGTEDTRRRASISELITEPKDHKAVETVVNRLVQARLLTTSGDESGETWIEISHEALVRGWPLLRRWIDEDREDLEIRLRLTEEAKAWEQRGRDEAILYRGTRLDDAAAWKRDHEGELNQQEREFLIASVRLDKRRKRFARVLQVTTAAVAVVMLALATFALMQTITAKASAHRAEAAKRDLEVASEQLKRTNADLEANVLELEKKRTDLTDANRKLENQREILDKQGGLLRGALAKEKKLTTELASSVEMEKTLRRMSDLASEDLRKKVFQLETANQAAATKSSPDGNYLLASEGTTATLFDRKTGAAVTRVNLDAEMSSASFSPDSRFFAVGSTDGKVKIFETQTGSLVHFVTGHKGLVRKIVFSPDQKWFASASDDGTVILWNMSDPLSNLTLRSASQIIDISFDAAGKTITTTGNDGRAVNWEVATGKQISTFSVNESVCKPFVIENMWTEQQGLKFQSAVEKLCTPEGPSRLKFVFDAYRKRSTEYEQLAHLSFTAQTPEEDKAIEKIALNGLSEMQVQSLMERVAPQIKKITAETLTEAQRRELTESIRTSLLVKPK